MTIAVSDSAARAEAVEEVLKARYAPGPHERAAARRVISVRPRQGSGKLDATIYDYEAQRAFELVLDKDGRELSRTPSVTQPACADSESADARRIVSGSPEFRDRIGRGELTLYEPMPAISVDDAGRRLVNVGVMSPAEAGKALALNEVVSVDIPSASIVRYSSGAPRTSRAALLSCGPARSGCSATVGPCPYYQILWPNPEPVWKLNVRHPNCTQSVQGDGTGLEVTNVYYKGKLVLKRGEMPVLNVLYQSDVCGPFRDWFFTEDCFAAVGSDVPADGSGIRVASQEPSTICASGSDAGNFKGVAIYDEGSSLLLMTEAAAGWYHYTMEWRFHLDGTIEPLFGVTATANSCTCNVHTHNVYWRFEWAPDAVSDGINDDPATGIATLERRRDGTEDDWDPVSTEATFVRPATNGSTDWFRLKNPLTGNGYILQPGSSDGGASGDTYAQWDLAALAENANEINDQNATTAIAIGPWLNGEPLGAGKRLVTWYHASFTHDDPAGAGEPCTLGGPKLVPLNPCAGKVRLDRAAYGCGESIGVTLTDSDLAGAGIASVELTSTTESAPETLHLVETPAGSGSFTGTIGTTGAAPVSGDGALSVKLGDTIHARYLDASACGTPDVVVEALASSTCEAPTLTNVDDVAGVQTAIVQWSTSRPATSVVHYGTTPDAAASAVDAGSHAAHQVLLSSLAECTTYYYWVESTDAYGNTVASNRNGGLFAFMTGRSFTATLDSADTPLPIPDDDVAGVNSAITVADARLVTDVNVQVSVTHPNDGNLALALVTPQGTSIGLAKQRGEGGANFTGTVFDDEAATPISSGAPPFGGAYRPEIPLSSADGQSAAGTWSLNVRDLVPHDTGTIEAFRLLLSFRPETCAGTGSPAPAPETMTAALAGSTIELQWDTGTCPAKNYHLLYGALASVFDYTVSGSVCGLGPFGSFAWDSAPADDLWFLVVGDDAASTEGTWGHAAPAQDRNGAIASMACGFTSRSNAATCP